MISDLIFETERQLAAHNCRKAFLMGASLLELRKVPYTYSDHGASAWMKEASRIIDEEIGKRQRECAA